VVIKVSRVQDVPKTGARKLTRVGPGETPFERAEGKIFTVLTIDLRSSPMRPTVVAKVDVRCSCCEKTHVRFAKRHRRGKQEKQGRLKNELKPVESMRGLVIRQVISKIRSKLSRSLGSVAFQEIEIGLDMPV
jgi:hypothetical protein